MSIRWPANPDTGLKFSSSEGSVWVYDGCGWIHSCCENLPINCSYSDGLTVWVNDLEDGGYYGFFYSYLGMSGENPTFQTILEPPAFIYYSIVNNRWEAYVEEEDIIIGYGPSLYGQYAFLMLPELTQSTAYIQCGNFGAYCLSFTDTGLSGSISSQSLGMPFSENPYEFPTVIFAGFTGDSGISLTYIGGETGWGISAVTDYHPLGCSITIPGDISEVPIGTFTLCDDLQVSISNGICEI